MNQEKLYQVILPSGRYAITVGILEWPGWGNELVVKQADPIMHWMMGIAIQDILIWLRQNGGSIKELRDSQARIAVS